MQKVDTSLALMQSSYNKIGNLSSDDVRLKEQTDKFEAFFIKKVLDISMKNESKLFGKDAGDKIYNSMYNDAMSNSLSGGFGFSQLLFGFLKENR
ncbi:rod-binding protein [Sulfurospirillum sp. 1307]